MHITKEEIVMTLQIKEVIKNQGLTIQELADKMNISRVGLSQHINGNPSVEVLERISQALGVHISELFDKPEAERNSIICPNCGKKFIMEDSHIPDHENIREKEYYK